jgi:2-methylcitrate dehydratase PrpD
MTTTSLAASDMTRRLAAFAVASHPTLPESALAVARLSLMDWAAVLLAGVDEPVSRTMRALVMEEAGAAQSTVVGTAAKAPARAAALANGTTSHALDYDDTHFAYVGHPSVAVFPAALAIAERENASGAAFLEAALVGMEAACRLGHWLGTPHYNHGFHQTATSGAFGAAIAAGRLLRLSEERMRHALGIVATRASGLKSQFGTDGKPFNAGIAASNGVEAALLAERGFVSRPDGIECVQGFAETHAGECRDVEASLEDLGEAFWFERVSHKFHACCHGTHAALDALNGLRDDPRLAGRAVGTVELTVNPRWLRVCDIPAPRTGLEAKFSYRLTSAMALSGIDTGTLDAFTAEICAKPDLVALRDSVRVKGDASIADTAARVSVALADGDPVDAFVDLDAPMPLDRRRARIVAKVQALVPAAADGVTGLDTTVRTLSARAIAASLAAAAPSVRRTDP